MGRKIILDVDTGSDDAVAIMTAVLSPEIEVEAICTVWGNKDVEKTTDNTLCLVATLGADIPVYKGCDTAMVKFLAEDYIPMTHLKPVVHNGKEVPMHADSFGLSNRDRQPESLPAAMFYVEYLRKAVEPVTLVQVGPLTNLGLALRIAPDIIKGIREIVIMGGGSKVTNCDPWAEVNIWNDPEAAQIVVSSGADILFVPLDATHAAYVTAEDCKRFRSIGTFAGDFSAEQCEQRIIVHRDQHPLPDPNAAAVHDALAVAYLIDPEVLRDVRPVHLSIGLGGYGEGRTVIDRRKQGRPSNVRFAFDANRLKLVEILCDCFARNR